jgi:hypothetical protein
MSSVGAAEAAGLAGIGMADIALWSMPFMSSLLREADGDEAGAGFVPAFLMDAFVAGFAMLLVVAGIVISGMLPWSMLGIGLMSIDEVLLDAGALCAVAVSGNASSSAASNAE